MRIPGVAAHIEIDGVEVRVGCTAQETGCAAQEAGCAAGEASMTAVGEYNSHVAEGRQRIPGELAAHVSKMECILWEYAGLAAKGKRTPLEYAVHMSKGMRIPLEYASHVPKGMCIP